LAELAAFDSLVIEGVVLNAPVDTLVLGAGAPGPRAWRANQVIDVLPGATVSGLLIAPVVRVSGGAWVRGLIIATADLTIAAGAVVVADEHAAALALAAQAVLRPVGRRGLLHPP
jgi:hypothetical protein